MPDGKNNKEYLRKLAGDPEAGFPSLYFSRQALGESEISDNLRPFNRDALKIIEKLSRRSPLNIRSLTAAQRERTHLVLEWIVDTGCVSDVRDKDYDTILDTAFLHLFRSYKNRGALPKAVDLVFERNRRGAYTYDLIWACFESGDPGVLIPIAQRLLSDDPQDRELARRLLQFIPSGMETSGRYVQVIGWIYENYPFLYYTGESLHQSCKPIPFALSLEAKYLCRQVDPGSGRISGMVSEVEARRLKRFRSQDAAVKELLSGYSLKLYRERCCFRNTWLAMPIEEQIRYARQSGGGAV